MDEWYLGEKVMEGGIESVPVFGSLKEAVSLAKGKGITVEKKQAAPAV